MEIRAQQNFGRVYKEQSLISIKKKKWRKKGPTLVYTWEHHTSG